MNGESCVENGLSSFSKTTCRGKGKGKGTTQSQRLEEKQIGLFRVVGRSVGTFSHVQGCELDKRSDIIRRMKGTS